MPPYSPLILGLTGGIASGKSVLTSWLENHGVEIIDADLISRELVKPNTPIFLEILKHFGLDILNSKQNLNLGLNRALLRQKIFENPKDKVFLENLLHPQIRQNIEKKIKASKAEIICLVIPLLKSRNQYPMIQKLILIDTPPEIQKTRLINRDKIPEDLAKKMINAQLSRQERLNLINKKTDFVIYNHEDLENLEQNFEKNFQQLIKN